MAKNLDLYIDQGSDFLAVLPSVTDETGDVIDLTDYSAVCQIRRSYATSFAVALTAEISDAANGQITLSLPGDETVGLTPTRYVYDVVVKDTTTGFTTRVFEGLVSVNPGVSSKPNTTLLTPYVPEDYGGL